MTDPPKPEPVNLLVSLFSPEELAYRRKRSAEMIEEQKQKEADRLANAKQWEAEIGWSDIEPADEAGSVTSVTDSGEPAAEWQPPVPLPGTGDLPKFPIQTLPSWAREWAEAEAEALQTPLDLPALLVLGVVSAILAKKIVVWITPGWHEPTNLYVVIALKSGEGKSPVFRHAMLPVFTFEREEAKRLAPIIDEALSRQAILQKRIEALQKKAGRTEDDAEREEIEKELPELEKQLSTLKIPARPRFICDDVTMEALAMLMLQQGGRMALFSSEGGPFEIMAGRYTDGDAAFELYLKAHSGDYLAVDRITRTGGVIYEAILTTVLTVQPAVIAGLAEKDGFRGRGLLARFGYSLPLSRVGTRKPNPPWMPKQVSDRYAAMLRNLIRIPTNLNDVGEIAGHGLEFDDEARDAFFRFKGNLEPHLGPGRELEAMADWVNKLSGLVLRLAGILHIADYADDIGGAVARRIGVETMRRAIEIGTYFLAHARAAFGLMSADPLVEDAKLVLSFVERKALTTVTQRDLHRGMQSRFRKAENLAPVIEILKKHGFLRELAPPYNPKGGQPERRFSVNPIPPESPKPVTELTEPGPDGPPKGPGGGSVSTVTDSGPSEPPSTPEAEPEDDDRRRERDAIKSVYAPGDRREATLPKSTTTGSASWPPGSDAYDDAGVAIEALQ